MMENKVCYYNRDMKFHSCGIENIKWDNLLEALQNCSSVPLNKTPRVLHEKYYDDSEFSNMRGRRMIRCVKSDGKPDSNLFEYISDRTCRDCLYCLETVQNCGYFDSLEEFLKMSGFDDRFIASKVLYVDTDIVEVEIAVNKGGGKLISPVIISIKKAIQLSNVEDASVASQKHLPGILIEVEQKLTPSDYGKAENDDAIFYDVRDAILSIFPEKFRKPGKMNDLNRSMETIPGLANGCVFD